MVKYVSILALFMVLFFPMLVFAHGAGTHIMGTVEFLDTQHVVVKTKEGKTVSILLDKSTEYRQGKVAATGADLKVGNRVVVDVTGEGDKMKASDIRFSAAGEKKRHEGMHPEK
jgi:hypothetical protein